MSLPFIDFIVAGIFLAVLFSFSRKRHPHPLPPSPRGIPLFGNLFQIPNDSWVAYKKWSKELGSDIINVNAAGTNTIVLNSEEAVTDLFEKRSSIYSSRPLLTVLKLIGWQDSLGLTPYGDYWRAGRRLAHQELNINSVSRFRPQQTQAAHHLLQRLLERPDHFVEHFRYLAGSLITKINYGIDVLPKDDPFIAVAERGFNIGNYALVPWAFLVNQFPSLQYIPDWLPGAGFKKTMRLWRKYTGEMLEVPYATCLTNMHEEVSTPSFVRGCLEKVDKEKNVEEQEHLVKWTAVSMFLGGSDTTVATLTAFILMMVEYPDVLKKAREEIDRVVGSGNLPQFSDEPSLPYTAAIIKEVFRILPVAPLSLPHQVVADDIYRGYRVPAGSVVISNLWAILNDEKLYPKPHKFNPDRFMKDGAFNHEVRDPQSIVFGLGRRICPGRFLASATILISVASIISVFDISKAVAEDGSVIEPSAEIVHNLMQTVMPFKCSIKPRSKETEQLVRSVSLSNEA